MLKRGTQARRQKGTKASARRRGFSCAEVMFAVIILGVGFIMIAALFPVAIRQSKSTADETSAAAFARVANNDMSAMASNSKMPLCKDSLIPLIKTGIPQTQVFALPTRQDDTTFPDVQATTNLWQSVRGNIISSTDPRYAWVPFYFRDNDITGNA